MKTSITVVVILLLAQVGYSQDWSGQHGSPPSGDHGPKGPQAIGVIVDVNDEAIPYASVGLYSITDSALVTGAATDVDGKFKIEAKAGDYYILASFLSYQDLYISDIELEDKPVFLGKKTMNVRADLIGEVVVEVERSQMELKLDKRVFNVGKDLANKGANASQILDNIPSIEVDVDGNVSLRGSGNVRLLIDGKPSGLTGISNADALRQLQGDMIEKVEVITNPSARYDAEGEVGIINIILKKEKRKGFNAGIDIRGGYPANHGLSTNFNIRRDKVNFFGSYGLGYRQGPGSGSSDQRFTYADTSYRYNRSEEHVRGGLSHNSRAGFEFDVTEKASLTIAGSLSKSDGNNTSKLIYTDFDELDVQTAVVNRNEDETDGRTNKEIDLDFRKSFKQEGRSFVFIAKYYETTDFEASDLFESTTEVGVSDITQRSSSNESESRWMFQTDYVHPFKKDGKFEMGGKIQLRSLQNDFVVETEVAGEYIADPLYDNNLLYSEDIYAAYMMVGNKYKRFSYQLGLRYEYSDVSTILVKTNEVNNRTYGKLFPSAHFSYEMKNGSFMQLSYSRRISRPHYWYLSPFFGYNDNRNFFSGNPNLNPEFTDSYETGFLKEFDKGNILASVYYRHTEGQIERVIIADSLGQTRMFPINLSTEDSYGIEFSGSYAPFKWWNFNGSFNYYHMESFGEYEGVQYVNEAWMWSARITSRWKVKRKFSCQTSFNYRSPHTTAQGTSLSNYGWDAGASLDMLKGKGTLTFSGRDLLNSRKWRNTIDTPTMTSTSSFQWRSRSFTLAFNYRINQQKRRGGGGDYGGGGGMF